MKRNTKIALALVGGLAVATVAYAHGGQGSWGGGGWGGYGPGAMMGGYGPGAMMGGYGYGRGGMMGGYGRGGMMGGYGPGAMMGGYGPGAMMGGYGYGPGAMPGGYGPRGAGPRGFGPFGDLDQLAERLNLTDAQKPLLDDLRTAVGDAREQRQAAFGGHCYDGDDDDGDRAATATSPVERMNSRVTHMEQRVASAKAVNDAFAKLYASLSPEQRAQADQLFARGRGFGNHHRWMHGYGS